MQLQITATRIAAAAALSLVLILQAVGNFGHRWSTLMLTAYGIAATLLSFSAMLIPWRPPSSEAATSGIAYKIRLWIASAVVVMVVLKLLDAFDVPWRNYVQ